MLVSGQLPGCLSGFPQIQLPCSDRGFPGGSPPFWTRKGPGGCWAQLSLPVVPFREVPSKLYTIHSFKYLCAYSSAAFVHLALLKTNCYLSGWNWIDSTSSHLSENYPFPCKRGMHSNSLHNAFRPILWKDGAKAIQQKPASKFFKHSQIFAHNPLW